MDTPQLEALAKNLRRRALDESRSIIVSMVLGHVADAIDDTVRDLRSDRYATDAAAEAALYASFGGTD